MAQSTHKSKFKEEHPYQKRCDEAKRIKEKYADRVPVCDSPLESLSPSTHHFTYLSFPSIGHLREGRKVRHRDDRQKEVPRPRRPDGRPVCLRYPQADQVVTREGHLHLRQRGHPGHLRAHVGCLGGPKKGTCLDILWSCSILIRSANMYCLLLQEAERKKEEWDGFLYVTYSAENTFGDDLFEGFEEIEDA